MKKIVLGAIAAVFATLSLSSVAAAESRGRSEEWRHDGGRQERGFDSGRRGNDGRRHQDAGRHDDRRHDRWQHRGAGHYYGWRGPGWRYGYWGGPRVVIAPGYADYCFIKKVRRYDAWGNVYVKRVRVCQ
jgi:hypothetical protein